jgi:hypothetical protein
MTTGPLGGPVRGVQLAVLSCGRLTHRFGDATDGPARVRSSSFAMTEAEWQAIRPLLPVPV